MSHPEHGKLLGRKKFTKDSSALQKIAWRNNPKVAVVDLKFVKIG